MNADARIITTSNGQVDIDELVETGLFDFDQASQAALWVKELEGGGHHTHTPETEEYGISSFVYTRYQPFDFDILKDILEAGLPGVVRAKGVVWLSHDEANAFEFSIAGGEVSIVPF